LLTVLVGYDHRQLDCVVIRMLLWLHLALVKTAKGR
jgi:hypothetical protein